MRPRGEPASRDETERIDRIYRRYAQRSAKQRAWAAHNPGNRAIRHELAAAVWQHVAPQAAGGGRVLDVGCGGGWMLRDLARRGIAAERLEGVDLSARRVDAARAALPGARFSVGDARSLDFEDDTFDVVLLLTVLSSMASSDDSALSLAEVGRVLAPGGIAVSYEPRIPNVMNRDTRLIRRREYAAAGFATRAVTSLTGMPPIARKLGSLTPAGYPLLARISPLRTHRLVVLSRP